MTFLNVVLSFVWKRPKISREFFARILGPKNSKKNANGRSNMRICVWHSDGEGHVTGRFERGQPTTATSELLMPQNNNITVPPPSPPSVMSEVVRMYGTYSNA